MSGNPERKKDRSTRSDEVQDISIKGGPFTPPTKTDSGGGAGGGAAGGAGGGAGKKDDKRIADKRTPVVTRHGVVMTTHPSKWETHVPPEGNEMGNSSGKGGRRSKKRRKKRRKRRRKRRTRKRRRKRRTRRKRKKRRRRHSRR